MATIKSFSDLQQSKELAKILPLESADMTYCAITEGMREKMIIKKWEVNVGLDIAIKENLFSYRNGYIVPCWSLASLLELLPKRLQIVDNVYELSVYFYGLYYWNKVNGNPYFDAQDKDNLVDACYEAIVFLHEQKLL